MTATRHRDTRSDSTGLDIEAVRRRIGESGVTRALEIMSDRWSWRILAALQRGARRFDALHDELGVSRSTLVRRLAAFARTGLVGRKLYMRRPARHEYGLTAKGRALGHVLLAIAEWDRRWLGRAAVRHDACGKPLLLSLCCAACGRAVDPHEVSYRDGLGSHRRRKASTGIGRRARALALERRPEFDSVADVLCDHWSAMVVAAGFFRVRRFGDLERALGIAPNILSRRLAHLAACGILKPVAYQGRPLRHEYRLTVRGHDCYNLIVALLEWSDRWISGRHGAPLQLIHLPCGRPLKATWRCESCGGPVRGH
ncbi:MAG: helix-turn-helix transcriptional regulator [Alphaproteobacteria bacterium]|nr:helix-turn-helix transcriptional regulator [Alphaproteobacteria bacterium]